MHSVMPFLLHASPLLVYGIVALALTMESCGVPVVNNTLLLLVGALASSGHLNIWALFVAALSGSLAGANLAYVIGARGGRKILLKITSFFHIDAQKVSVAENWYQKSGVWMIFLSRLTPYVRPFASFPAGISRMPYVRFFAASATGSLIWCAAMLYISWALGRRWGMAVRFMRHYTLPAVAIIVLVVILCILSTYVIKRWQRARRAKLPVVAGQHVEEPGRDLLHV